MKKSALIITISVICVPSLVDILCVLFIASCLGTGEKLKYPTGGRAVSRGSDLAGKALLLLLERLSDAVFQGAIDQKTESHDHHQRHDALRDLRDRVFAINQGSFKKRKPRSTVCCPGV